jgi:hypothetical protein
MGTRCVSLEITNLNFFEKGNSFWSLGVSFTGFGPVLDSTLQGPYSGQAHALGLYPTHFIWSIEIHHLEQYFCLGIFVSSQRVAHS